MSATEREPSAVRLPSPQTPSPSSASTSASAAEQSLTVNTGRSRPFRPADGHDRPNTLLFREQRRQRAAALGAILSNAASLAIFGIAAVMILGDMGFNLAPVLASAGVCGSPGSGT